MWRKTGELSKGKQRPREFLGSSVIKAPPINAGDMGLVPASGRSSGGGNGNSLQYSHLENSMDRELGGL